MYGYLIEQYYYDYLLQSALFSSQLTLNFLHHSQQNMVISGARGARGAPWVRKFGNPLIRKILVLTSASVRPSVKTLGEGDGSPKTA